MCQLDAQPQVKQVEPQSLSLFAIVDQVQFAAWLPPAG